MFLKALGVLSPVVLGGLWVTGALGSGDYSRDVNRTPAQVMQALADLDVRQQPGSPETDPSASGGIMPVFRSKRMADSISFVVMSGSQVATQMIAHLEPLDGGKRTRVTAEVKRGDAPDDQVSPAFRSNGITMGLFAMALEDELNQLTGPPRRSREECGDLERQLLQANAPVDHRESLSRAVATTARTVVVLNGVEGELRRQGCDTASHADGPFTPVSQEMSSDGHDLAAPSDWDRPNPATDAE